VEKKKQKPASLSDNNGSVASHSIAELRKRISDLESQLNNLKQIEQDLRESRENFQDIFETLNEGIAYMTLRGKVLAINKNLEHITGIRSEDLIGRNILRIASDLLGPDNLRTVLPILSNLLRGNDIDPFQVDYKNRIFEISTNINKY
jgi:PAS domain-containing protein